MMLSSNQQSNRDDVCLMFKDGVVERFVGVARNVDGVRFNTNYRVLLNSTWQQARMTHNIAIARWDPEAVGVAVKGKHDRGFVLVGGQYRP